MRLCLFVLLFPLALHAAPVPKEPAPDPLGRGYMGVFSNGENSLTIKRVVDNSAASKAGLMADDIFVRVGPISSPQSFDEIRNLIVGLRPGTRVELTVKRGTEMKYLTIELAPKPPENVLRDLQELP